MTWALEHGRILQTPGLFLFGMLVGCRKYFLYSEQNGTLVVKSISHFASLLLPHLRIEQYVLLGIHRTEAVLVPLQLILSSFSSLSFMVLLVTGLLLTFYRVKDRSFFYAFHILW